MLHHTDLTQDPDAEHDPDHDAVEDDPDPFILPNITKLGRVLGLDAADLTLANIKKAPAAMLNMVGALLGADVAAEGAQKVVNALGDLTETFGAAVVVTEGNARIAALRTLLDQPELQLAYQDEWPGVVQARQQLLAALGEAAGVPLGFKAD